MPYTSAQKLNRRIRIERKTTVQDEYNQPLDVWVLVCKLWCRFKVANGGAFVNQEFQAADREVSRITASIRVRKRPGITAGMRVVHQGVIYEIRVVLPDLQDNRYLNLGVAQGANDG